MGHTSSECLENPLSKLNEPSEPPVSMELEQEAIASVINQRNLEMEEYRLSSHMESMVGQPVSRPDRSASSSVEITSLQQGEYHESNEIFNGNEMIESSFSWTIMNSDAYTTSFYD